MWVYLAQNSALKEIYRIYMKKKIKKHGLETKECQD